MKDLFIIVPLIAAFLMTIFLMPYWIRKAKQIGLMWDDMNKLNSLKVAGSGGIIVCLSFIISTLLFLAYRTFFLNTTEYLIETLALLLTISLFTGIEFMDDLLGWQHGGLSIRSRIIFVFLCSIPLIAINAGSSTISLPFFGSTNLGLFYPLLIIPLGIVGATTTFNFLAGFNGLEAGQGIILLSGAAFVSYYTGNTWLSVICLCLVFSLIGFLFYNIYPAQVFPGNSVTYVIGALFAISSIYGGFQKVAIFFFIPYIIEVILKSRGRLVKQSFGKPLPDKTLDLKYDKLYGLTHVSIYILKKLNIKSTEKNAVYLIWLFQIIIILIGILIFREGIFLR
jgi:UDP-N-acetylglucosamine--dolichyl-phosphate N-acetylglucosaminephosphotransferase